jgi:hypothetical protein
MSSRTIFPHVTYRDCLPLRIVNRLAVAATATAAVCRSLPLGSAAHIVNQPVDSSDCWYSGLDLFCLVPLVSTAREHVQLP